MNNDIKKILEDLYQIDPSLKDKEQELIKLIDKLLKTQPDTKLDENFVIRLRNQVMAQAKEMKPKPANKESSFILNFMNFKPFAYVSVGIVIALIVTIPTMRLLNQNQSFTGEKVALDIAMNKAKIAKVGNNAFGSLGSSPVEAPEAMGRGSAEESSISSQAAPKIASDIATPGFGGGGGISDEMARVTDSKMISMPAPDLVNYEFKYIGEDININESSLPVYKRNKDNSLGQQIASVAGNMDYGLFDISKLKNTSVGSFQLTEDREFGYITYFNFPDNSVSISMNWEQWPQPEQNCRDEVCFEQFRLKPEDVPNDAKLISIADKFLRDYGIDKSNYGEPRVNRHWENTPVLYRDGGPSYVPEIIPIIYPYNIEGQSVQDEGGNLAGLTVEVNIRYNRAAGTHGLVVPSYESSSYTTETDSNRLIDIAKNGGLNRYYENPEAKETVTLELGTPERGLIRHWQFDPGRGKGGEELFVPALIFPIMNKDEAPNFWQKNVVVPLVKDILNSQSEPPIGIPEPMPLLRGEAAPGSPGNANSVETDSSEVIESLMIDDNGVK